jgi:serine/threonine protein kinase
MTGQYDDTISQEGATLVPETHTVGAATRTIDTSLRTTVLPRVELVGEQSKIVADGKVRYELTHRLGEGGVGEVIMARDNDIDRDVAVKRLRAELQSSNASVLRFAEEVRTVGRLEHPNIVPIHDVGVHPNGEYYFVMKYVQGETLENIIEKLAAGDAAYHEKYGFERRVEIMMGILEAIAYAHSKKIIHRDIKPANVMVGPYGEVVMMDWGLAREIRGPEPVPTTTTDVPEASGSNKRLFETQVGAMLGTPAYMSPEQARGQALDERSDVYSLSMMFYELLTLHHPFEREETLEGLIAAILTKPIPYAVMQSGPLQGSVPADLSWYVERGLRKDKDERYQSVEEMIVRLRNRASGDIPVQCPITFTMRATTLMRQSVSRRPFLMSTVFLLGTVATFALAFVGVFKLVT